MELGCLRPSLPAHDLLGEGLLELALLIINTDNILLQYQLPVLLPEELLLGLVGVGYVGKDLWAHTQVNQLISRHLSSRPHVLNDHALTNLLELACLLRTHIVGEFPGHGTTSVHV